MIKTIGNEMKVISDNSENHPQYLKFQRLLDQYFEIINDEEQRQRKFIELAKQSQKLEKLGIFPSWEMQN
ncbi:MAG: hypothetical protein PVI88_04335 [Nitrosopumilaceae archaeon]|jgi:hypothetical protein